MIKTQVHSQHRVWLSIEKNSCTRSVWTRFTLSSVKSLWSCVAKHSPRDTCTKARHRRRRRSATLALFVLKGKVKGYIRLFPSNYFVLPSLLAFPHYIFLVPHFHAH